MTMQSKRTLLHWLDYIQQLHPQEMDFGLDRVREVYCRLFPHQLNFKTILVAGTNGKGSTCELMCSILQAHGLVMGKFTSPHLIAFNERFQINGKEVDDDTVLSLFPIVEKARGEVTLTFFEYSFLLSLVLFAQSEVDLAILEVGLGGRLDATNIIDADIAVVTNISFDHMEYLGDSLEEIGAEKIAISRTGKPCVLGMREPPNSVLDYLKQWHVPYVQLGVDFDFTPALDSSFWQYFNASTRYDDLPRVFNGTHLQMQNASVALTACELFLQEGLDSNTCKEALSRASLLGRCQRFSENPLVLLDVAHNVASVEQLSQYVQDNTSTMGKKVALCGMLHDKEVDSCIEIMHKCVDEWHFVALQTPRSSSLEQLAAIANSQKNTRNTAVHCHLELKTAFEQVYGELAKEDTLVIFGSFYLIGAIIPLLNESVLESEKYNLI